MTNTYQRVARAGRRLYTAATVVLLLLAQAAAQSHSPAPADVERRVESILNKMTIEEKIDMLGGVDGFFIRGLPRLGLPRLMMADGPLGVRNYGPATAMAGGIGLAATWNPDLAERVGVQLGRDARAKGVHFLLGPGVNIYRAPFNGRNFEYLGEDPFLASRIAVGYIKGVQSQDVCATIKHFMGNNSEFDRHNTDSIIDERTMREIYLPVFEAAVKQAHVGAIMDSYNLTNGLHLTQNGYLNNDIAKKDWGFQGIIMSDWFATYDGVAAANGGMDLEMPGGAHFNRATLLPALKDGTVSEAVIDDKVKRILRVAIEFGWLDRPQQDLSIPRFNAEGRQAALQASREGMVLLKNENVLPLNQKTIKSIAVIGPDAYPAVPVGGGSAHVEPFVAVSFLEGLTNAFGTSARVLYHQGLPDLSEMAERTEFSTAPAGGQPGLKAEYFGNGALSGEPSSTRTDRHIDFGGRRDLPDHTASARWTGYYSPKTAGSYVVFVQSTGEDGGSYRLSIDDKWVFDDWKTSSELAGSTTLTLDTTPHKVVLEHRGRSQWLGSRLKLGILPSDSLVEADAKEIASKADAVVVTVGFDSTTESEGADRTFTLPPGQNELIQQMAAANKNTIVVITSGGAVDMSPWISNVPAVVEAWYPGQEGGTALADILLGKVNPSGRLPVTFERRWEDNPVHDSYYPEDGTNRVEYKEGLFVGYRGYEKSGKKPLFPFGFGLSYTTFEYSKLSISPATEDGRFIVSFDVTNSGKVEGAEVAQVYVGQPQATVPMPAEQLKGFARVTLRPGQTKRVSVDLDRRALSYYDVNAKAWRVGPGAFEISVGRSSQQIELKGTIADATTSAR
ncbi:MAG TPA: glycoside hydrolase family 3 C-terminal domain-containing protein [Blastocatellia bacterium]|nr:glycoside hydrolase family 3 C-terminal domain-containing protein [Blastocatellia bacterium]